MSTQMGKRWKTEDIGDIRNSDLYRNAPRCAQKRILEYPPDRMYKLRSTGHIVPIHAYVVNHKKCDTCMVKLLKVNNPGKIIKDMKMTVAFGELEMLPEDLKRIASKWEDRR